MDDESTFLKHFQIANLIYANWKYKNDTNSEFKQDMREASKRAKELSKASLKKHLKEKKHYIKTLKSYSAKRNGTCMWDVIPLDIFSPLISPNLSHVTHPLRRAEERYLLAKHKINDTGDSIHNWALIGMALSEGEAESPIKILFPTRTEKRGRRKSGMSIDYQRAVWKLFLEDTEVKIIMADDEEFSYSGANLFTLNELLDVFLCELGTPLIEGSSVAFQDIESRLKLKSVSRDTLITSFSRGEKERRKMWDS